MNTVYDARDKKIIPQIIYSDETKEKVRAITYTSNGIKYQLSNEDGHKVSSTNTLSSPRPMTKKEFKEICTFMLLNTDKYPEIEDEVLDAIDQLDFGIGHANSTFEITKSFVDTRKVGTLVLNLGAARYLYNQDTDSVFHIDHSRRINGHMLKQPEKESIVSKITSSKTMKKKINKLLNN